jgi:hypothetical protein
MISPALYAVLLATVLCSCGSEGPREIYPSRSHSAGAPDVQREPLSSQLKQILVPVPGVETVTLGKGSISLHLGGGRDLILSGLERWDFDATKALAMLYAETRTTLKALSSLSPQKVPPPSDLLKAMHLDPSRIKEAAFYESVEAKQTGIGLYVLFLGPEKGKGEPETAAVFLLPKPASE